MSLRSKIAQVTARLAVRLNPHLKLRDGSPDFPFIEDGLGTIHNTDFTKQPRFIRAYELGKATGSWNDHDLRWRIHVLLSWATVAARLQGAFVECGVNRGGFARAIIDYIEFTSLGRDYYLFDTFAGFDPDQLSSSERQHVASTYQYAECYAEVQREFAEMPFVKLVRGSVPQTLFDVGPVAFLSIDMNCAAPEIAAARFFWPKLVSGGVIVLDDYGFSLHHEQKLAFDSLVKEWGVEILSLPTGQGIICKS